jgi:hypothetical protein
MLPDASPRAAMRALAAQLDAASSTAPMHVQHYAMAGAVVAVHTSAQLPARQLLTALEPLRCHHASGAADLHLYIWDGQRDALALPESALPRREDAEPGALGGYSDAQMHAFYQADAGVLSTFDAATRRAHWWMRDVDTVPYFERAAPFKHILQCWIASRDGALLHSAAIASADPANPYGILVSGPSGSGKSSTALACLEHGMGFASDDYVMIDAHDPPRVHLAYSTAKVLRSSLARFPGYGAHFRNLQHADEKPMLFVHEFAPKAIRRTFTPVALVLPCVAHRAQTRFVPVSPAAMLRALAPSSLMLFPLAGGRSFTRMAALCRKLPCLRAELADDPREVAAAMAGLLEQPAQALAHAVA